jgi:hypothetical protein
MTRKARKLASADLPGCITVANRDDVDRYMGRIKDASGKFADWIKEWQADDPVDLLRRIKFETTGFHPILGHPLNLIEQINQTWTFIPDAGGFLLSPGAHAARELDVMSQTNGLVGAETFAAVDPNNNRKLGADLLKLATRVERHRYVFFMSPRYPDFMRRPELEKNDVQVWSIGMNEYERL